MNDNEYIKSHTLKCEVGFRGGGIEIDCTQLFPYIEEAGLTAYQNYLGGSILGAIQSSNNFEHELKKESLKNLKRYEMR